MVAFTRRAVIVVFFCKDFLSPVYFLLIYFNLGCKPPSELGYHLLVHNQQHEHHHHPHHFVVVVQPHHHHHHHHQDPHHRNYFGER